MRSATVTGDSSLFERFVLPKVRLLKFHYSKGLLIRKRTEFVNPKIKKALLYLKRFINPQMNKGSSVKCKVR